MDRCDTDDRWSQVRDAAPPAVDRFVAAEVFFVGENGFAEFGQREATTTIGVETAIVTLLRKGTQVIVKPGDSGSSTECKPLKQVAVLKLVEDAGLTERPYVESAFVRWYPSRNSSLQEAHFRQRQARSRRKAALRGDRTRPALAATRHSDSYQAARNRIPVSSPDMPARPRALNSASSPFPCDGNGRRLAARRSCRSSHGQARSDRGQGRQSAWIWREISGCF